ncbi:hypothetical protein [Oceanobacillus saliphilus]|uniref:hypothetical protein n=1 Tax=Oceanobacillus saliphilus TaxID=2925834 RepID=UPI00201DF493|nr:hypothetical protein [Oceanobacillus saliphilus]
MPSNQTYEIIWNPDVVIDLAQNIKYAKTTINDVYDKTNVLLGTKPDITGHKVIFKGFEYNGYKREKC